MKMHRIWIFVALSVLLIAVGCSRSDETMTALPTHMPQNNVSPEPSATLESVASYSTPVCPPARGEGTISPAVSIYSITFVVNGLEQTVRAGDMLEALSGDKMSVREITICSEAFSGNGGEVCVDFAPIDQSGKEIVSDHGGTHMVQMISGFMIISGPSHTWIIDENWRDISAVLNHWPPEDTDDLDCSNGRCEHDDRIIIEFR